MYLALSYYMYLALSTGPPPPLAQNWYITHIYL